MSDPTVTLRLQAENSKLLPPVRASREAVSGLGDSAAKAGVQGGAGMRELATGAATAERDVTRLSRSVNSAVTAVGALASIRVAQRLGGEFLAAADRAGQLEARMRLNTSGQEEYRYAMERSQSVARNAYKSINDVAEIAIRSADPMRQLGFSIRDTLDLTEALSLSLVISAANTEKSSATIDQFSKAMQNGTLRGQQFQSVVENAPRFVSALEAALGKTRAELVKMAEDGQLTVSELAKVAGQLAVLRDETESMPTTVEDARVRFADAFQNWAGDVNSVINANKGLVAVIDVTGEHIGNIATTVGVLAVALGGRLVSSLTAATVARVRDVVEARRQAQVDLQAARAAEANAAARVSAARAGMAAAGGMAAAEAELAAAQARTAAATQAASVALTAKAFAIRAASAAMAAFGGPVGLAITALTLFVMWAKNSKAEADRLAESVTSGFQSAIDTLNGFSTTEASKQFASLAESYKTVDNAQVLAEKSASRLSRITAENRASQQEYGLVLDSQKRALAEANDELEVARLKHSQLSEAAQKNTQSYTDLILKNAGVTSATEEQRAATERVVEGLAKEGQTLDQVKPILQRHVSETYSVEAANQLASASFDAVASSATASGAAVKAAADEIATGLNQQINQMQLRLIEQSQGKAAALRAGFIKTLADKGVDPTSAEAQALRALNEQLVAGAEQSERFTKATQAATQAQSDAKRKAEEHKRAIEQQAASQAQYNAQAAEAAELINGPVAAAEGKHIRRVMELDIALKNHKVTLADYNTLIKASAYQLAETSKELSATQKGPQALLDAMSREVGMMGLVGVARERQQRQLRNEHDMRRAINDANKAGAGINAEMTASLVDQARAIADLSIAVEMNAAEWAEWADVGARGVADVADLMADTLSGGLDTSRSFFDELKSIFRSGWRDVLRTFMEQSLVRPIQMGLQNLFTGALNGAGGSGGGWFSQLVGTLSGGNNLTGTGAMAAGSGWMGAAAGVGSLMGFGNNTGALAGIAGAATGSGGGMMDVVNIGGTLVRFIKPGTSMSGMLGKFAGSSAGMWGGAALGALYGWQQGGDTVGKGLGAGAYGTLGYGAMVGLGAGATAIAGGASMATAGLTALKAIPVAGWVALGAVAIDKMSGGKLFGTKYATKESGQTISVGADGGSASAYAYQEGQKSMFRGKKRRTVDVDASDESRETANELYQLIQQTARGASEALGLASVDIISGSFRAVYDNKGNLTSELATVLGRTFNESFEQFQARLQAENMIAQIDQLDGTATAIAERWRGSAEKLLDGAQFLLAAAVDINEGASLLAEGGLSRLTDLIEKLRAVDESMTQAYQRVMSSAMAYGDTAAGAYQDVATAGFSNFAKGLLQVRQEEQARIRTLQAQAKALGGLAAREADLAKVREAAQLKTDALAASLQGELVDLALNRLNDQIEQLGGSASGAGSKISDFINSLRLSDTLSPDTDAKRRVTANDLMNTAALAGDADAFTQYAQQFLEVSRALNASGAAYQTDFDRVLELSRSFGGEGNAATLETLYAQRDALKAQQEAAARLERAQRIAQGVSDLSSVRGGDPLDLLRSITGLSPEALAGDLGMSVGELGQYLAAQQTDIGDLADILYELPKRIAAEMITVLVDREVPLSSPPPSAGGNGGTSSSSQATIGAVDERSLAALGRIEQLLQRQATNAENAELLR